MFENITDIDLKIMSIFIPDYSQSYTLREITIKKGLNYSNAHNRFKFLLGNKFINSFKKGKSNIISLNLNPPTLQLISHIEVINKIENVLFNSLIKKVIDVDSFACIGLFGSRADNKNNKYSDWDIFILTNKRKEIEKEVKNLSYTDFDFTIINEEEFIDSLKTSEETIVKHIIHNKRIIYNPYPFYNLIYKWELIKNVPTRV